MFFLVLIGVVISVSIWSSSVKSSKIVISIERKPFLNSDCQIRVRNIQLAKGNEIKLAIFNRLHCWRRVETSIPNDCAFEKRSKFLVDIRNLLFRAFKSISLRVFIIQIIFQLNVGNPFSIKSLKQVFKCFESIRVIHVIIASYWAKLNPNPTFAKHLDKSINHLKWESASVFDCRSIDILSFVGTISKKLIYQVPMSAMKLYSIKSCFFCIFSSKFKLFYDFLNFHNWQFLRSFMGNFKLRVVRSNRYWRGCDWG